MPPRAPLSWRCRSLRRATAFPCLSQGMKTLLGLLNHKLQWPGSRCPCQCPVMSLRLLLGTGPDGAPPYLHRRSVVQRHPRPRRDLYASLGLQPFLVDLQLQDQCQLFLLHRLPTIWKAPLLPPALLMIFSGCHAPLGPSSANVAAPPQLPQDARNILQGPTQEMVQSWKAEWFEDMKLYWQQLQGDAPPQSTVGPAVSQGNMGPDALRQLSPSDDR